MAMTKLGQQTYSGNPAPVYLLTGNATRDAESRPVNGKDHTVVGIKATEDKDGNAVYVNLNGWRSTANAVGTILKGDSILAVGTLKTREYNGKTYYDLDADFVAKSGAGCHSGYDDSGLSYDAPELNEIADDGGGELPF